MTKQPAATDAIIVADTAMLLMTVAESIRHSLDKVAASFDLTPAQARALLGLESAVPMRSLADHLHCDASNVTGIADRLEARGLVTRQTRHGDRRVKLLALTRQGAKTRARLEAATIDASPIMTALSADEREALRDLLFKIVTSGGDANPCTPPTPETRSER